MQHYKINTIQIASLLIKYSKYGTYEKKIQTTKHLQCIVCPILKKCYPFPELHSLFVHVTSNNRGSDDSVKLF